jgi:tetratricopeptide (TPR) repeat protein
MTSKTFCTILVWACAASSAFAQQARKLTVDPATPSGKALQAIIEQQDPAKKQELLESFAAKFPTDPGVPWVYGQLQPMYLKAQEFDKVLEAGTKALEMDPDDPDLAYQNLKASEGKKDPDLVKQWALRTSQSARKIVAADQQSTDDEKKLLDYARQLDIYTEYSVYVVALQSPDPAKTIELTEDLEKRNAKSQYLPKVYGKYLNALRQTGQNEKACTRAEELAVSDPTNEDILLVAADANLQKRQNEKVLLYAGKLLALLKDKPKPEGLPDADWARKKDSLIGLGLWMEGVTYGTQSKFAEADKALREGLPLVTDDELKGMGLFHLGWANYQLGKTEKSKARMLEGLKFTDQSAAIASPVQAQAQKNARVMRTELVVK